MSIFFFSSRRRHTRYIGDWSSDVCSSDLGVAGSDAPDAIESVTQQTPNERIDSAMEEISSTIARELLEKIAQAPPARSEERRVGKECRNRNTRVQKKKIMKK